MAMGGSGVSIDIANESGEQVDEPELARLSRFVLDRLRVHPQAELSILLVDEATMAEHHQRWMDESGPTDVLSFPMDDAMPGRPDSSEPGTPILGDIVLSPEVAAAQAKEAGHSTADEMHMLSVHGVLHILGYDHAEPEQAKEMFGLQNRLLDAWRAKRAAASGE